MKPVILFLATFLLGAALAFATRVVLHEPYAEPVLKSEVSNLKSGDSAVVNTVCAICGMDVDPDLKPATYQDKRVGFGCSACPSKFAKDPDRYGPSALRNEVVKN